MADSTASVAIGDPHVVLDSRHILVDRRRLRKRPRQQFGLEHGAGLGHNAVEGRPHPADYWVPDPALYVGERVARISLEPAPIKRLCREPELHNQIPAQVLRLELAPP
jgi:hypothetical protein